ncbi:cytochrome PufQ [Rhodobacter sp. KR11]|jgi:hypothetical protein|uniref:cytochrome PufQ n=1 Tax=Rhodobacter sp. KR11 TaxID=2974588 RepID=UPI002221448B|nr:cytochrome PufQ [Rhodobacter sp. KR11]MCW1920207.1 cytochrome PufQ [Rhodobacter sp. KR11]
MSDQSADHHARTPRSEFTLYYALILVFALPIEALGWLIQALWHRKMPCLGPIARARRTATEITPMIFWP